MFTSIYDDDDDDGDDEDDDDDDDHDHDDIYIVDIPPLTWQKNRPGSWSICCV